MGSMPQKPTIPAEATPKVSTQASGYLLTGGGHLFFTGILLLAVWYGKEALAVLASLMLAAALFSRGWSRLSLAGVRGRLLLAERRAFPGDVLSGRVRLVNRKPLPLPWVELEQALPVGLTPVLTHFSGGTFGDGTLRYAASLGWYQALQWRIGFACTRRGYFPLSPLTLTSGDPFGFYTRQAVMPPDDHVLVYPRLIPFGELGIPSCYPAGDERTESRLFPDPTRTVGVRDYRPGDPLRAIHWKASARQRRLQVKVFEAATTRKIALFVAVNSFRPDAAGPEGDFEFALSVAASLAYDAIGRGASVGLFANSRLADTGQPASLDPAGGQARLTAILETLAKVTPAASGLFAPFLKEELRMLCAGTTLVFILSSLPATLPPLLEELKRAGRPLILLWIGEGDPGPLPARIPCHRLRRPAEKCAAEGRNEKGNGGTMGDPPETGGEAADGAAGGEDIR
jgi:uncharacterized protein (DUF58 family)